MRTLFIVLSITCVVFSASRNRNSLKEDTLLVSGVQADSSRYSGWLNLSDKEDIAVVVKVDDTTSDGFASDSINFIIGYQVGDPVYDTSYSASNERYARSALIILDTLTTDSLGTAEDGYGYEDSIGVIHEPHGQLDTTNVPGWAVWRRTFYPKWGVFIRFFVVPLSGHSNTVTPIEIAVSRRQYIVVRNK